MMAHDARSDGTRSLLMAHDVLALVQVSQEAGGISCHDEDDEDDIQQKKAAEYSNSLIKVIRVTKSANRLGVTVRNEGEAVIVARIVKGGAADLGGYFREGEELLEVNNIHLRGKNVNEVSDILANMTGQLVFVVAPSSVDTSQVDRAQNLTMYVRALFDYDPENDVYIPCHELGIAFRKGEVLHVVSHIDSNWWQAYRMGEEEQALPGLIPSKSFLEVMEGARVRAMTDALEAAEHHNSKTCCIPWRSNALQTDDNANEPAAEILTYEKLERHLPQPNRQRPIVLIGPPDVGRSELRKMLMQREEGRFVRARPHTSRQPKPKEIDSEDYHFVPKQLFEADILANKFVEHGVYRGDYYGTSLEAIRSVFKSGKTCVICLHPSAIKLLRDSGLMPYVVYVAPPNIEQLKQNLLQHLPPRKPNGFTAKELTEIIDKGRDMESKYGHYIDFVVTTTDYTLALEELLAEINRIDVEPQWVPTPWLPGLGSEQP